MATSPVGQTNSASGRTSSPGSNDALQGLDLDHFLKLMIAELQNQDPLNPLESNEVLQQISEMRQIGATDKMTRTLDAVLLGQNLSSASSLIGKEIKALTDDAVPVQGLVDRVSVANGTPKLHIGNTSIGLNNISEILSPSDPAWLPF